MKELTIDEIKKVQLDILIYIDKVCKDNNIEYSLAYGTLLGAVRHKGFIPWDDDIDILLKRSEYNKLIETLSKEQSDKYRVFTTKDEDYYYLYAKVADLSTVIKEKNWPDIKDLGVYIDIFPIDYLPDENGEEYYNKAKYYMYCLYNCLTDIAFVHNKRYMRAIKKILRNRKVKKCRQQSEWYWKSKFEEMTQINNSSHMANIVDGGGYRPWESSIMDSYSKLEFENHMFNVVSDYDIMLKSRFGDYMQLPPENERVSNHDFKAYWK